MTEPFMHKAVKTSNIEIRDVWSDTLDIEMKKIRQIVRRKCYVAMDTEFPGVVARPIGSFTTSTDYQYQTLRCNVDLLRIIQLGIAFFNDDGSYMEDVPVWQFNFKFSLGEDMYAQDSIEILKQAGIDFPQHEERGIDVTHFGELLVPSGLVLDENIKWISFQGSYDFGYLLKLLTCAPLPAEENAFFELLHIYFPCTYDLKYVAMDFDKMGGLSRIAEDLQVERIGTMHQAGSDALLTAATFFKMMDQMNIHTNYTDENNNNSNHINKKQKYNGQLYGLGNNTSITSSTTISTTTSTSTSISLSTPSSTNQSIHPPSMNGTNILSGTINNKQQ